MVPHFQIADEREDGDIDVVSVSGEIHVSTAPRFRECLDAVIDAGNAWLVLDLSAVEFIDSTGLSVLLNGLRIVNQRQGHMALVCTNPTVLRLFQITSLDTTFMIFPDRAAAVAHVRQETAGSSGGAP
ncbi:MAG: anti-sigma factor antagonist [Solirubrobacteraceae bacterium]|nr:anti-sigma factor antagonist [Solirubrobacteraceae bacterium]